MNIFLKYLISVTCISLSTNVVCSRLVERSRPFWFPLDESQAYKQKKIELPSNSQQHPTKSKLLQSPSEEKSAASKHLFKESRKLPVRTRRFLQKSKEQNKALSEQNKAGKAKQLNAKTLPENQNKAFPKSSKHVKGLKEQFQQRKTQSKLSIVQPRRSNGQVSVSSQRRKDRNQQVNSSPNRFREPNQSLKPIYTKKSRMNEQISVTNKQIVNSIKPLENLSSDYGRVETSFQDLNKNYENLPERTLPSTLTGDSVNKQILRPIEHKKSSDQLDGYSSNALIGLPSTYEEAHDRHFADQLGEHEDMLNTLEDQTDSSDKLSDYHERVEDPEGSSVKPHRQNGFPFNFNINVDVARLLGVGDSSRGKVSASQPSSSRPESLPVKDSDLPHSDELNEDHDQNDLEESDSNELVSSDELKGDANCSNDDGCNFPVKAVGDDEYPEENQNNFFDESEVRAKESADYGSELPSDVEDSSESPSESSSELLDEPADDPKASNEDTTNLVLTEHDKSYSDEHEDANRDRLEDSPALTAREKEKHFRLSEVDSSEESR